MCGIAGVVGGSARGHRATLEATALQMANMLKHRGPDGFGVWCDESAGVALSHRRVAVLDLSQDGHQPMQSHCGRYVLTYNGEVYNFRSLRRALIGAGHRFRGTSDTEVLLASIVEWGLAGALGRINGVFAFGVWDREKATLHLVRDRLGEKPLYYAQAGEDFVFGSEIGALRAHTGFSHELDPAAVSLYLRFGFVPTPFSIFAGVRKLPPGAMLTVGLSRVKEAPEPEHYWDLRTVVENGIAERFRGTPEEATNELEDLLRDAVGLRAHADVPVGAFLSGGIDSSAIVALMQETGVAKTFTIAMPDAGFDESQDARAVARHLGTDHTEVQFGVDDALRLIARLPEIYDEPFGDPSQLPTLLLAATARRDVTVGLSGDGGDECFGGYNRHIFGSRVVRWANRVPRVLRVAGANALDSRDADTWNTVIARLARYLPLSQVVRSPGEKIQKLADVLRLERPDLLYMLLVSVWRNPSEIMPWTNEPSSLATDPLRWPQLQDPVEQMMFVDTAMALPDDMLTKFDRACMSVGLEARAPLLDHRVVEFSWRLPMSMKIRNNEGKWLLRQVLYRHVPRNLVERPKMGFDPPIGAWLRGPLRDWAENLLDRRRITEEGLLDPGPIRRAWEQHMTGRRNCDYKLWCVLMLEAWMEEQRVARGRTPSSIAGDGMVLGRQSVEAYNRSSGSVP
jgi:asparagine synthase (glutamine-hydrolysing)